MYRSEEMVKRILRMLFQHVTMRSLIMAFVFLTEIFPTDCDSNKKFEASCPLSTPCHCCLDNVQCDSDNRCDGQCKDGYFGNKCLNKCPDKCKGCTDHPKAFNDSSYWNRGYCTECVDGFYSTEDLYQCQSFCPWRCRYCNSSLNCISCKSAYFLQNGQCTACKTGCASCSTITDCNECQDGYFNSGGVTGNLNCVTCTSVCTNQCDKITGTCICKAGYTGSRCDSCVPKWYMSRNSCFRCQSPCDSCTSFSICTSCVDGYYLNTENNSCLSCTVGCARCSSNIHCDQCKTGYFGSGTGCAACSSGCNDGLCDVTSGSCTCKPDYDSDRCDRCAPKYQFFPNCDQCVAGYFGSTCNQNCPTNCNQSACRKENGICIKGCVQHFMGDTCADCVTGRFGPECSDICPDNCYGRCTRDSGYCQTCKPNFVGVKCDNCKVSKYGTYCNLSCSTGCKDSCDNKTGYCDSCVNGYYGNTCQLNCPDQCLNETCDIETGKCVHGCIPDYSGDRCCLNGSTCGKCSPSMECIECEDGFFGSICSQNCSTNCAGRKCDKINGTCISCVDGHQGDFCEKSLSMTNGDKGNNRNKDEDGVPVALVAGAVAASIIVVVAVLLIVFLKKRSNREDSDHLTVKFTSEEDHENQPEIIDGGDYLDIVTGEPEPRRTFPDGAVYAVSKKITKKMTKDTATADADGQTIKMTTQDVSTYDVPATKETTKDIHTADVPTMKTSRKDIPTAKIPTTKKPMIYTASTNVPSMKMSTTDIATADVPTVNNTNDETATANALTNADVSVHHKPVSELASEYYNTYYDGNRGIAVNNLASFVEQMDERFFNDEFKKFPKGLIKPTDEAEKPHNLKKNRFNAIYPYDETRVILEEPGSDFINACYIEGFRKRREYIASFGPIAKATEGFSTFWRMVWQERTEKIVMLTNLRENGGMKCEKYWPDVNVTILYGDVSVTCHSEDVYAEYNVRSFTVKKGNEERSLHHIHYTAWPDKGVPDDVTSMIEFRSKVNATKVTLGGPIIVHCSAGVGRTGTYIALDILTLQGQKTGQVDVFDCVEKLRQQRTIMVQTAEQYEYVYRALVHSLTLGSEAILAEQFRNYMLYLSKDEIKTKFELLTHLKEKVSADEHAAVKRNTTLKHLSRAGSDIPGDINRPRLYQGRTAEENSFINAVFVNSFKVKNQFIMTQSPLPTTVNDFLTLIVQEKCSCIVSMDPVGLSDESIGTYMPADNQVLRTESFEVRSVKDESNNSYSLRTLTVTATTNVMQTAATHTVQHFQCSHWPEMSKTPKSTDHFLLLVNEVQSTAEAAPAFSPVLVHCRTGSERSGLLCVVVSLLQKMEIEHEVSVINTVRQVKLRRPRAIPDTEQFSFCHDCVSKYLEAFDIYSNFT